MRYLKTFGLLAAVAAALMAFAGTVSATTLTDASGNTTPTIKAVNEGHLTMHGSQTFTCSGTEFEGKFEKHGAGVTTEGKLSKLTITGCDSNRHFESPVRTPGSLIVHHIAGTHNGTVTYTGARVPLDITTFFGTIHCEYVTSATHFGTLTGTTDPTKHAVLNISATILIDEAASSGLCGETATWTMKYKFVSPTGLHVTA